VDCPGSRSFLIGLCTTRMRDYYAATVLAGVVEACRAAHYQVIMQPCDYRSPTLPEECWRNVKQARAAGVILTPAAVGQRGAGEHAQAEQGSLRAHRAAPNIPTTSARSTPTTARAARA
jgi:LacI family transcriptional regulator